jgi:hypothetical protein
MELTCPVAQRGYKHNRFALAPFHFKQMPEDELRADGPAREVRDCMLNNSRAELVWAVCVAGIPPPMIERGLSCSVLESWFILEVRIETNGAYIATPCKITHGLPSSQSCVVTEVGDAPKLCDQHACTLCQ